MAVTRQMRWLVGALAVATVMTVGPSAVAQPDVPLVEGQSDDARLLDDPAVGWLAAEQGISRAEALTRLQQQVVAEDLNIEWAEDHPEVYSGLWFDADGGPGVTISATDQASVAQFAAAAAAEGLNGLTQLLLNIPYWS